MQLRRGRWWLTLTAAVVLGAWAGAARAATPPIEVENLRIGLSGVEKSNLFKIGSWTPVWVQLRAGADGFQGFLDVVAPDDDGTPTAFRQPFQIAAGQSQRIVSYARPGTRDTEFTIRVLDKDGRRRMPDVNTSQTRTQISPVMAEETLLIALGKPRGVDLVPNVPGFTPAPNAPGSPVTVGGFDTMGGGLPGRWYAYDGASAIVLDTNDRETMKELNTPRGLAVAEWVKRGGHLVVSVGGNWQAVKDSFLGPMLPGVPTAQERVASLEALDSFAGATKQITPPGAKPVMVTKLEQVEARGGKTLVQTSGLPLVVRGAYGFGRVTAVMVDVDQKPFTDWPDRALFWVRALDLRRVSADQMGSNPVGTGMRGGSLYRAFDQELASKLRRALDQFPGVKLVPFGWVAFFIFLYIIMIGPFDYLFLKKVVKRMELTWVTFPLIVISVSLLAYYAAYAVKGDELRVNKIDIVDVDQPAGIARGSSWLNVFSPRNRDYRVEIVPLRLDRPTPEDGAESLATPAGTEVLVSWQGNPQQGFGGMGQSGSLGFSSGGYDYVPVGSASALEGVRIPIWSTKALTARWFGPSPQLVESDLRPVGPDRLTGTVTNTLDIPLRDALLAFGKQVYILGTIAPNATIRVEMMKDRFLSGQLQESVGRFTRQESEAANNEVGISRPDLALALMFHDSLSPTAANGVTSNDALHYLDLTGQLALGRPMLVARIDRPTSRLVLNRTSQVPKTMETTMLRVILPLNDKPAGEPAN